MSIYVNIIYSVHFEIDETDRQTCSTVWFFFKLLGILFIIWTKSVLYNILYYVWQVKFESDEICFSFVIHVT